MKRRGLFASVLSCLGIVVAQRSALSAPMPVCPHGKRAGLCCLQCEVNALATSDGREAHVYWHKPGTKEYAVTEASAIHENEIWEGKGFVRTTKNPIPQPFYSFLS